MDHLLSNSGCLKQVANSLELLHLSTIEKYFQHRSSSSHHNSQPYPIVILTQYTASSSRNAKLSQLDLVFVNISLLNNDADYEAVDSNEAMVKRP